MEASPWPTWPTAWISHCRGGATGRRVLHFSSAMRHHTLACLSQHGTAAAAACGQSRASSLPSATVHASAARALLPPPFSPPPALALTRPAAAPRNTLSMTTEEWEARLSAGTSSSKNWHSSTPEAGSRTLLGWGQQCTEGQSAEPQGDTMSKRCTATRMWALAVAHLPPQPSSAAFPSPPTHTQQLRQCCTHQMYGCSTSQSLAPAKVDIVRKRQSTRSGNVRKLMHSVCCPPSPSIRSPLCSTLPAWVAGVGGADGKASGQHQQAYRVEAGKSSGQQDQQCGPCSQCWQAARRHSKCQAASSPPHTLTPAIVAPGVAVVHHIQALEGRLAPPPAIDQA